MSAKPNTVPSFPDFAPHSMLNDRYQLLDVVGRGATAVVWSAWDTHLRRIVALKLIQRGTGRFDTTLFEREASLICTLEHPHIVPLYDYGFGTNTCFLVTRYLTGGTLSERLYKEALEPAEAINCMSRIALALDYIHEKNILHRDLKPGNILLDAQAMPYLADFGLAKVAVGHAEDQSISGTLNFMAPEQLVGRVSAASDVFAFGVMFYQMLTGSLPFGDNQALGMAMLTGEATLPDIQIANPGLSREINPFLQHLTHQEPDKRPKQLSPFVEEMSAVLGIRDRGLTITLPASNRTANETGSKDPYNALELLDKLESAAKSKNDTEPLSLTDFLVLDTYLQSDPEALSPAASTIILKTALHYNRGVERWGNHWLRTSVEASPQTRLEMFIRLIARELLINPHEYRSLFLRSIVGSVLAFALQLYMVITPNPVTGDVRLLNAAGNGLLFGLFIGIGLFTGIHIARRWRLLSLPGAAAAGWLISSLIIAITFIFFQKLFYLDTLEFGVAWFAAILYSAGFIWTANEHPVVRSVFGIAGIVIGYILPFVLYLNEMIERPPFIFRDDDPAYGIPLVFLCALISTGFINLLPFLARYKKTLLKPSVFVSLSQENESGAQEAVL